MRNYLQIKDFITFLCFTKIKKIIPFVKTTSPARGSKEHALFETKKKYLIDKLVFKRKTLHQIIIIESNNN